MHKGVIFLDGRIVPADVSFQERLSPGRLPGKGVFETMRAYNGEIFLLQEHLKRLLSGLNRLKIRSPYAKKEIVYWLRETLRRNRLKNARVRLTVWKEKAHRPACISIAAVSYRALAGKYKKGFRAMVCKARRNRTSPSGTENIKSIDYSFFLKAYQDAVIRGCDEAILLNKKGEIVEGTRANVFFVKDGVLLTPELKCGCLNGITRQMVLKLAKEMRIRCRVTALGLESLLSCDEAFLTNSLIEIMPLTMLGTQPLHQGKAGPITLKLLKSYRKKLMPD